MQDKEVILDEQEYEIPNRSVNLRESQRKTKKKEKQKSLAIWQPENVKRSAFFVFETEGKTDKFCIPFSPANLSVSITQSFHCARGTWQMPYTSLPCHLGLQAMQFPDPSPTEAPCILGTWSVTHKQSLATKQKKG